MKNILALTLVIGLISGAFAQTKPVSTLNMTRSDLLVVVKQIQTLAKEQLAEAEAAKAENLALQGHLGRAAIKLTDAMEKTDKLQVAINTLTKERDSAITERDEAKEREKVTALHAARSGLERDIVLGVIALIAAAFITYLTIDKALRLPSWYGPAAVGAIGICGLVATFYLLRFLLALASHSIF